MKSCMDKLSTALRHQNLSAIRSKNTEPERVVRRGLWARGFRYRLNSPRLPGHPDIVLRKYRTCIFVNGCFWHGHHVSFDGEMANSACCKLPHTNREFWIAKIKRNQQRDKEQQQRLASMGWHCITVWECDLKPRIRDQTLQSLAFTLNSIWLADHGAVGTVYRLPEEPGSLMAAESREQET